MKSMDAIRTIFAPPVFADEEKTVRAYHLNILTLVGMGVLALYLAFDALSTAGFAFSPVTFVVLGLIGALALARYIMVWGYVKPASHTVVALGWLALAYLAQGSEGIRGATYIALIAVVLIASLLLGTRAMVAYAALTILAGFWLAYMESVGAIESASFSPQAYAVELAFVVALCAVLLVVVVNNLSGALERTRANERELRRSNEELLTLQSTLEARIAARAKDLATTAEVSRRLSTILDPQKLVSEVVNQVQTAFDYYYVHIYLLDEKRQELIMSGGTGEAGAAMLAAGHRLTPNQGLVGRAFKQNKLVLVADTLQEPGWLSNPLLPGARSEIAVPIGVGEQRLGVLDVQQNKVNGLTEEDSLILQAIADQLAIALQNARLYAAAERQANRQALINSIGQRIQSAATIEMALEIAAEELGKATGAAAARAQIGLSENNRPTL